MSIVDLRPEVYRRRHKRYLIAYLVLLVGTLGAYYLLFMRGAAPAQHAELLTRLAEWLVLSLTLLIGANLLDQLVIRKLAHAGAKYNLRRVLKLITGVMLVLLFISILFSNLYTTVLSLGIVSIILGFALQSPITSFIAWIYILFRSPFRVGDRIQIGNVTGDVLDISYLDTTLWEFGGQYLSTDHPSGRVIKFPNSMVLTTIVYNYSWDDFPYIWNEVKLRVAYTSDLQFVGQICQDVTEEFLGEQMLERVKIYKALLSATAIDGLNVNERPTVVFRTGKHTWIEVNLRYLVYPREQGRVRSRLLQLMLAELKKYPDRVQFPSGSFR